MPGQDYAYNPDAQHEGLASLGKAQPEADAMQRIKAKLADLEIQHAALQQAASLPVSHVQAIDNRVGLLMLELDRLVPREERSERSRCMNIARTQIELGMLMAVKAVTL